MLAVFLIENTEYRNLFKTFHFLEFASGWCLVSVLCNGAMWSCGPMCATKTLSDGQAHPAAPSWTLLGHTEGHPAHRHPAEMCHDHFQALGSRRNSSPIVDHLFETHNWTGLLCYGFGCLPVLRPRPADCYETVQKTWEEMSVVQSVALLCRPRLMFPFVRSPHSRSESRKMSRSTQHPVQKCRMLMLTLLTGRKGCQWDVVE